jgi:nitric oxide reductase NorE protein
MQGAWPVPVGENREDALVSRHLPGDEGVWLFIAADSFMFTLFFSSFIYERTKHAELFNASQQALNPAIGALNTLFLLSGSWFVVLAVDAARKHLQKAVLNCLSMALACGAAFATAKVFEYADKVAHGITMVTNDFYMFYFVLTGLHFVHLIIGMVVLGVLLVKARRGIGGRYMHYLESGASYWHMVDVLWIMLFPLLYLVR